MARVVITGLGAVSPVGCGVAPFWNALVEGRSGLAPITRFDASPYRNNLAGEVRDFDRFSHAAGLPPSSRATAYALAACREALADAALRVPCAESSRVSLSFGTNFGSLDAAAEHLSGGRQDAGSLGFQSTADLAARVFGVTGPVITLSLSCASGVAAIGYAADLVSRGRADVVVACGFDELSEVAYTGLNALRTITPDVVRPFDKNRKGTLFAEGAGAVVVESEQHASRRGARCYVEVLGHAVNNDAFHMTAPDQSGRGITEVMRQAISRAGLSAGEIEHVNAHGTGTPYNDKIETGAIRAVFGSRAGEVPVVSLKGTMGHTMGAAGALETIAAVLTLRDGILPPTVGLETPDPECDLDYVPGKARPMRLRTVLSNSYGIGGANAAVVLRALE